MGRHSRQALDERWCILRTAGPRTLPLMRALQAAGYAVWTPQRSEKRRKPGGRSGKVEREIALMPTFVFAPAIDAGRLLHEATDPTSTHPKFSVFRFQGKVPLIADRELEKLRAEERRGVPREQRRTFAKGHGVRVPEGPFAGMSGVVQEGDGKWTMVCFANARPVKIATFLLVEDVLADPHPSGIAALAA